MPLFIRESNSHDLEGRKGKTDAFFNQALSMTTCSDCMLKGAIEMRLVFCSPGWSSVFSLYLEPNKLTLKLSAVKCAEEGKFCQNLST